MLWLIWIALMLLIPIGAGVHVWWRLHRTSYEDGALPQPAQQIAQGTTSIADSTQIHWSN